MLLLLAFGVACSLTPTCPSALTLALHARVRQTHREYADVNAKLKKLGEVGAASKSKVDKVSCHLVGHALAQGSSLLLQGGGKWGGVLVC